MHGRDKYNTMAGIPICALQKCNSTQFIFPFLSSNRVQWIKEFLQFFVLFWFCLIFIVLFFFLLLFFSFSFLLSFALVMFIWLHFRCHNCLHWPPQHIHAEQVRTGLLLAFMPASFEWGLVAWWIKELVNQGESGWFDAWWSHGSLLYWFDGMYLSYTTDNFKMKTIYM